MQLTIWDVQGNPPKNLNDQVILWRSYAHSNYPNAVAIPTLIEKNAQSLRASYLSLISDISSASIKGRSLIELLKVKSDFSFWWLTYLNEKCNYSKSPHITDIIRFFAFQDWAKENNVSLIRFITTNKKLAQSVKSWCNQWNIKLTLVYVNKSTPKSSIFRRIYQAFPHRLKAFIWLIKNSIDNWSLKGVGVQEWRKTEGKISFVNYLTNLSSKALASGDFESPFWPKLPDALDSNGVKTNWLHIFVKDSSLPNSKRASDAIMSFNNNKNTGQVHVTLYSFLSVSLILKTVFNWLALIKKTLFLEKELSSLSLTKNIWPLLSEDWKNSIYGVSAMNNFLTMNLFASALSKLPVQEKGIYLQENQGWEFGLIHLWKENRHGTLIGFPHSTVRFWDLRYFFDPINYTKAGSEKVPMPDKIACNGELLFNSYKDGDYPLDHLVNVESLRYLYLHNRKGKLRKVASSQGKVLLVVGDYLAANTHRQIDLLERTIGLFKGKINIIFKPHPACSIDVAKYLGLDLQVIRDQTLDQLMDKVDVVYSSAVTSAALDAYCAGLPLVTYLDGETLNMSPLRNMENVTFVSHPTELASFINNLKPQERKTNSSLFYTDPGLPRWKNLLMN